MRHKKYTEKLPHDLSTMVYGKVPPHATDVEQAVLGAIMLEGHAFDTASEILKKECFYSEHHKKIFEAFLQVQAKNRPIDILSVTEELKKMESLEVVGGPFYVTSLTNSVTSAANIESHCRIIYEKFLLREMIRIGSEAISRGYEDMTDVFELMEDHEKQFTELTTKGHITSTAIDVALVDAITSIEELRKNPKHITGIPCCLPDVDRITHGWQNTDLIILAARPGVGKTAFALQIARNAALNDLKPVPVGFFSLEMSTGQLMQRNISAESEIYLGSIRNGHIDDEQMGVIYRDAVKKLLKGKIFFDDTAALSIQELRARCRRLKRSWVKNLKTDSGIIIVDYIQLMSGGKSGNREQEISQISRGLKQIAKELKLPLIALSQLSRATETRKGDAKMPQLSDLRESGAIEQDADMVMFLYRPEYYDQNSNEMGESTRGETHLKIAKHRNGSLETVKLTARLDIQKFIPFEGGAEMPHSGSWRPVALPYKDDSDLF